MADRIAVLIVLTLIFFSLLSLAHDILRSGS